MNTRPAYALPDVSSEAVAAILRPVQAQADRLGEDHSPITAREALNRLWFLMHAAQAQLTAVEQAASRTHAAEMRQSYDLHA